MAKKPDCQKSLTLGQKWLFSALAALLFVLISSSFMYKLTGSLTELAGWTTSVNGCPNIGGLILHTVVFLILIYILMILPFPMKQCDCNDAKDIVNYQKCI